MVVWQEVKDCLGKKLRGGEKNTMVVGQEVKDCWGKMRGWGEKSYSCGEGGKGLLGKK